jgi:elongation factor G
LFLAIHRTSDLGPVAGWHQKIIDQVVEINEKVMDRYLDEGESGLQGQELHDAFEQCLREGHLVPVCFVSARSGAGVRELLDIAGKLFPHPGEANPPPFVKGSGDDAAPIEAKPDPDAHVIADVFRIVNDPFVGKLGIFRVYQGTVRKETQLFVDDGKKPFKVAHLFKLKGKEHVEIAQAIPATSPRSPRSTNCTSMPCCTTATTKTRSTSRRSRFPKPMFGLAVEAAHKGQEQKLSTALHKLSEEDPASRSSTTWRLNETVLRGCRTCTCA